MTCEPAIKGAGVSDDTGQGHTHKDRKARWNGNHRAGWSDGWWLGDL